MLVVDCLFDAGRNHRPGRADIGVAGPRRPQDRIRPSEAEAAVEAALGRRLMRPAARTPGAVPDGAVSVAAITSRTNTSDPRLLIAAALFARNARRRGLTAAPWVKTSLAPGSPSDRDYLARAGLLDDLSVLGFDIVGFGCTTCIGNSGPLPPMIEEAEQGGKAVAAVLSGNRNFPGRVHPRLDLGFLASPPLIMPMPSRGRSTATSCPIRSDMTATARRSALPITGPPRRNSSGPPRRVSGPRMCEPPSPRRAPTRNGRNRLPGRSALPVESGLPDPALLGGRAVIAVRARR